MGGYDQPCHRGASIYGLIPHCFSPKKIFFGWALSISQRSMINSPIIFFLKHPNIAHIAHFTLCKAHCTFFSLQGTLHSFPLCKAYCTFFSLQGTLHIFAFARHIAHFPPQDTLHIFLFAKHIAHFPLWKATLHTLHIFLFARPHRTHCTFSSLQGHFALSQAKMRWVEVTTLKAKAEMRRGLNEKFANERRVKRWGKTRHLTSKPSADEKKECEGRRSGWGWRRVGCCWNAKDEAAYFRS